MNQDSNVRLTVLMPIHRGRRWIDSISKTINHCPAACRIIVSDITQHDDALDVLEQRHLGDQRVCFRRREGVADWRLHANELLSLVDTELFSIMPQDDEIGPGYYEELIAALDVMPSAGLAFGVIEKLDLKRNQQTRSPTVPIPLGVKPPWKEAIHLDLHWNLGIPYRGVVRQQFNAPLPLFPHDFADQVWVFGIALQTYLVEVPTAVYLKQYHENNTHSTWKPLVGEQRLDVLLSEIEARLADQPGTMRKAQRKLIKLYKKLS